MRQRADLLRLNAEDESRRRHPERQEHAQNHHGIRSIQRHAVAFCWGQASKLTPRTRAKYADFVAKRRFERTTPPNPRGNRCPVSRATMHVTRTEGNVRCARWPWPWLLPCRSPPAKRPPTAPRGVVGALQRGDAQALPRPVPRARRTRLPRDLYARAMLRPAPRPAALQRHNVRAARSQLLRTRELSQKPPFACQDFRFLSPAGKWTVRRHERGRGT